MWRTVLGGLVVAHGFVTILIWSPNPHTLRPAPPMDTSDSWLLGGARSLSLVLAIVAGLAIAAAGIGFLAHQQWWSLTGLVGGALSLVLFCLFFTPWWAAGLAISAGLVIAAVRVGVPA